MMPCADADVEIRPPPVNISMQKIQEGIPGDFSPFPDEFPGRWVQRHFLHEIE
jgi:hypothetical protein